MSFKFYLIIENRYGTSEFMSESSEHMKSIDDVIETLEGDDCNPVSILEITDDSAPREVIEDVAIAYAAYRQETKNDTREDVLKFNEWMEPHLDDEANFDWQADEAAQYRASVL